MKKIKLNNKKKVRKYKPRKEVVKKLELYLKSKVKENELLQ